MVLNRANRLAGRAFRTGVVCLGAVVKRAAKEVVRRGVESLAVGVDRRASVEREMLRVKVRDMIAFRMETV